MEPKFKVGASVKIISGGVPIGREIGGRAVTDGYEFPWDGIVIGRIIEANPGHGWDYRVEFEHPNPELFSGPIIFFFLEEHLKADNFEMRPDFSLEELELARNLIGVE